MPELTTQELKKELETMGKTVKTIFDELEPNIEKMKSQEKGVAELKEQVNIASQDIASITTKLEEHRAELQKRADEFEMKMKERVKAQKSAAFKSVGDLVLEADTRLVKGYKYTRDDSGAEVTVEGDETKGLSYLASTQGNRIYKFKSWNLSRYGRAMTLLKTVTDAAGSAQDATDQMRIAGILPPPQRALRIRDLFMVGQTTQSSVEFVQESSFTGDPAPQANQGDIKQILDAAFTLVNVPVRTIAGYIKASTQILRDVSMMQGYLDGRLTQKLGEAEETQLLLGTGLTGSLLGIIPQATSYSSALETSIVQGTVTPVDRVKVAITQIWNALGIPDAIALAPQDWASIELTKTDDGAYMFVNPQSGADPRLWGFPVSVSSALTAPQAVVGAWMSGAQIWDSEDAAVSIANQNEDDYIRNLVTMKAEERIALTVYYPEWFVEFNVDGSGSGS